MKKKIVALVVCVVLIISTVCTAMARPIDLFSDVPTNHWAFGDINKLRNLKAISGTGDGTFDPEGKVTREQFLKILIDGFAITPQEAALTFADVKKGSWYESYIETGIASGIVTGKSETLFGVGENITRQDACVMVLRAMATNPQTVGEPQFDDAAQISDYAKKAVAFLADKSVLAGFSDNTFRPMELCTRSQAAKIISSAIDVEAKFYDGKRKIVFMGDSITNAAEYVIYFDSFLKTRFPHQQTEVILAGNDGDTVAAMLQRYDDDVVSKGATDVYILFGANDINRGLYPGGTQEQKDKAIAAYVENLEKLFGKLKESGIRNVTLLTAPALDERDYKGAASNKREGISEGMSTIAQKVIGLGKKYGIKVIDLYSATTKILNARKNSGEVEIIKTDRIHPNRVGHFVIANEIIKSQYGSYGLVASVEIDASAKTVMAKNASTSDLAAEDGGVSYTYTANALPMGIDSPNITEAVEGNGYSDAEEKYPEFVDFTSRMNREIIKVTGLAEGTYDVAFDGKTIASYSAEELAKGVNIATLSENPGQIKAKAVVDSFMKNYWTQTKVRRCETRFTILKQEGMSGADKATLTQWVDTTYPSGHVLRAYWTSFLGLYEDFDIYKNQWDRLERNAYKLAQPGTYTVTISPAK